MTFVLSKGQERLRKKVLLKLFGWLAIERRILASLPISKLI